MLPIQLKMLNLTRKIKSISKHFIFLIVMIIISNKKLYI